MWFVCDWSEKMLVGRCWFIKHRTASNQDIIAEFLSSSTLNLIIDYGIMVVGYYDDFCVNIVWIIFWHQCIKAQYRRKIAAKVRSIMRPTCGRINWDSLRSKMHAHGNLFGSFSSIMSSHNLLHFTTIYHASCSSLHPGSFWHVANIVFSPPAYLNIGIELTILDVAKTIW